MRKSLLFLFFLFPVLGLYSQSNYFSDSAYISELNTFMSRVYTVHPEAQTEYEKLNNYWNSGTIDDLKFGIVYISNTMKNARLKAYPQFYYYIATLNSLIAQDNIDYYREWEVGLLSILNENKLRPNVITDFLEFSLQLIRDSVLIQNGTVSWKIKTKNYEIGNDPEKGIFVFFNEDFTLYCYENSNVDSFLIQQVSGTCYPLKNKFEGKHGRVTWERYGIDPQEVFSKFDEFEIDLSKGELNVKDAVYTNSKLGVFQIPGELKVKLVYNNSEEISPKFVSDKPELLKKMLPETQILGYVVVNGKSIYASGDEHSKATFFIQDNNENIATIRSSSFKILQDSLIYSYTSNLTFYLNNHEDSLHHVNIEVSYKHGLIEKRNNGEYIENMYNHNWFTFDPSEGYFLTVTRKTLSNNELGINDSYNKVDILSNKMIWKKGDDSIYFVTTIGSNSEQFVVMSDRYFDGQLYSKYSGIGIDYINHFNELKILYDSLSPLGLIITPVAYQKFLKVKYKKNLSIQQVKNLMKDLLFDGFLDYDLKNDRGVPTKKLYTYLENSQRLSRKDTTLADYDYLRIVSQKGTSNIKQLNIGTNAILNLKSNDLMINYVLPFKLSSTVLIRTNQLAIGKDRNIRFGGIVRAGFLFFESPKFVYNYKKNLINVSDTSQLSMLFIDTVVNRKIYIDSISTKIQNVKGEIHIAEPNNKSLINLDKSYPKFITLKESNIFYQKFLLDTVKSKEFFFEAKQFEIDSLNFITKDNLKFEGMMNTGLFKPLPVTLTVQKAKGINYLGFRECVQKTDSLAEGLEFKNGTFFGCFYLNEIGLFGDGKIEYASAQVFGKGMQFKPDQVIGLMDSIEIGVVENTENIPVVRGKNLKLDWRDNMFFSINNRSSKYFIYQELSNPANLDGNLYYSIDSVYVSGNFIFSDATLVSKHIDLKQNEFFTDTCNFILTEKNTTSSVFKTDDLNGRVDIKKQMGAFFSNGDTSAIYFKDNNYLCFMDHFLWKIGDGIVDIGGVMQGEDTTRYATSVEDKKNNPDKTMRLFGTILQNTIDTLTFNAATTTFDINSKRITATKVPELRVSDAKLIPGDDIVIGLGGTLEPLTNCEIIYPFPIFGQDDSIAFKHYFYDAVVFVKHRFNYNASNAVYLYPYKDQKITFSITSKDAIPVFTPNSKLSQLPHSYAEIHYPITNQYMLNPYLITTGQGDIILDALKKYPQISGYAKVDSVELCSGKTPQEFKFDLTDVNPDSVILPFSFINKSRSTITAYTGIVWGYEYSEGKNHFKVFDGFLDAADTGKQVIYKPSGNIYFNEKKNEYRVSSNKKLLFEPIGMDTIVGDYFAFNKDQCIITSQGEYNLFNHFSFNKPIELATKFKGVYRHNLATGLQEFQGVLSVDFPLPNAITDRLIQTIFENEENEDMTMEMNKFLNIYLGIRTAQELYDGYLPDEFRSTFVFSNVNIKPAKTGDTLYTSVSEFEIVAIDGKIVRRKVKGFISYVHTPRFSYFTIIIKPNSYDVYAFRYNVNKGDNRQYLFIYLHTSDEKFNKLIVNMKSKEKSLDNNLEWHFANWEDIEQYTKQYTK